VTDTIYEDLCYEPLDMSHGVPMGIPGYPAPYRFAVEVGIVTIGGLLGTFVLGTGVLGGPRWHDVTQDCEGLHWTRGGEPASRPIAGELNIRLNNNRAEWSPWQSPFFGPGTMVRVVCGDGTSTITQITGTTVSWNESCVGLNAYEWVDITAWENISLLSAVDDHALDGVVGGGDTLTQRVDRLMDQADWVFGAEIETAVAATYQATDFAQDVLTELYRTVDSVDCVVYSSKHGEIVIRDRATGRGLQWTYQRPDQDPDSVVTANDDDRILSSVDLARVGGTVVTYSNVGMAERYQRRSTQRTDLITVAEAGDADLQRVANGMLARARQTYRPVTFAVESGQGVNQSRMIVESDITDRMTIDHGAVIFDSYAICAIEHDVTVAAAGIYWRATFSLDIEADSHWFHPEPMKWDIGHWDEDRWT
jgi:hypothetical protein